MELILMVVVLVLLSGGADTGGAIGDICKNLTQAAWSNTTSANTEYHANARFALSADLHDAVLSLHQQQKSRPY
jgi:hypothetical protein